MDEVATVATLTDTIRDFNRGSKVPGSDFAAGTPLGLRKNRAGYENRYSKVMENMLSEANNKKAADYARDMRLASPFAQAHAIVDYQSYMHVRNNRKNSNSQAYSKYCFDVRESSGRDVKKCIG